MASNQPTPNPQAILQCLQPPGVSLYYSELAQEVVIGSDRNAVFGVQAVREKVLPLIAANINNLNPVGAWVCDDARKWDALLLKVRPLITRPLREELGMSEQGEVVEELRGDSEATKHRKARQCLPQLTALYNAYKWSHRMPVSVVPRGTQLLPPTLQHLDSAVFRRLAYESAENKVLAMIDGNSRAVSRGQTPVLEESCGDPYEWMGAEFVEPMDPAEAWQLALNLAVFGVFHSMPLPHTRRGDSEALAREVARIIAACAPVGRAEALRVVQLTSDDELARDQLEEGINRNGDVSPSVLSVVDKYLRYEGFTTSPRQIGGDRRKRWAPASAFDDTVTRETMARWRGCLDSIRRGDMANPFAAVED